MPYHRVEQLHDTMKILTTLRDRWRNMNSQAKSANEIFNLLIQNAVPGKKGSIDFNLAGVSFKVKGLDVVGGILQEWLENWLIQNKIKFTKPDNSQEWPDLTLGNGEHLEVKAFNYEAGPAFDLGNFRAYIDSLIDYPSRLFDKHLVFGYSSNPKDGSIEITRIWLKNIWELTGPSPKNVIELQVKKGVVYNLRPKKFYSPNVSTYESAIEYVNDLGKAIDKFKTYSSMSGDVWSKKIIKSAGLIKLK